MRNYYPYVPSMVQAITVLTVLKMMTKAQTSCGSGSMNGKIMYERLPNIQLQGFDEDIVRDTMAPFMVLEKCQDLCLKDRNSQNIVRACASFDFQPGSRIATYNGGPEYEESTCYLSPNQARPEGMGSLMIVPNSVHFNEVCLTSNRPDRECPNRKYVFERHPRKRLKLPMPDIKELQASNRSECEDKCLDEFSFVCRSAVFDSNQGMCILSRFTRRTHPELLQDDPDAEYLENTCLSAERRCDGLAVFIKEENRRLGGPFEVDSYTNITLEECQGMCVRAEKYFCRSIEYDEMTKQCTISEEDSVSQKDDIALASSATHHFYDFACLDSPSSQQNRHQRDSESRGSEYPDNSVTSHLFTGKKPDTAFQRYRNSRLGGEHHSEISGRSLSECLDECLRQPSFQCRSAEYSERFRTCRLTRYNQKDGMRIIYDADYDYYENLMRGESEGRPGGEGGTGIYRPGEYPHRDRPGDRPSNYPRPGYPRPGDDYPPRPGGDYPGRPGGDYPGRPGGDYPERPSSDYPPRPGSGDYPSRPGPDFPLRPGSDYTRPGGDYPPRPGYLPYDRYPPRPRPPVYRPSSSGGGYDDRDRYYPRPPYSRIPQDDYPSRPVGPPRDRYPDRYPDRRYPDRYPDSNRDRYPYYPPSSSGSKYHGKYPRPPSADRYGDRERYGGDRGKYGGDYGSRYGERYPDDEYSAGGNYRPSSSGTDKYGGYDNKYSGSRYPDRYGDKYGDRYGDKYGDRNSGGNRYGDKYGGGGNRFDYYGDNKKGGNRWFFRPDRRPIGRPVDPVPVPYDPIRPVNDGSRPPYGGRPISPGPDGPIYDSFGGIGPVRPFSSRCDEGGNFKQLGSRQRARKEFVRKVSYVPTLIDCERECSEMREFICRSFNYKDIPVTGYDTNKDNCELSDRDSRDMELNNPQFFESTGNYEYYERSLSRNGIDGDCLDVSQVCNEDGMEFTLRTPEGFYGRIYTYGNYERCFFRGNGGTINVLRISGSQGFPECGTQRYGDTMTNIVVVQFSDYVQTGKDKRFNLTCLFRGPGEAVVSSGFIGAGSGGPIPIEYLPAENTLSSKVRLMILYQGRPTTTIAVGDPLTFRLESQDGYNYVTDIFATNVVARDPYTGRSVQLIDRFGCPVDPFVFPELDRGRSGDSLEARFNAFKIPESNFLVFEATVRTCKDGCQPAYCPSGSGRSEPSFGRKRRSVNESLIIDPSNNTLIENKSNESDNKTEETSVVSFVPSSPKDTDEEEKETESPEYVREMIEVFDSREELQQEAQRAEKLPETVCLTKGEYHSLVVVLFSLLALLLVVVLLVTWGYRRYWSVIKKNIFVNRSASNVSTTFSSTSYPNTRSSNFSGGMSIFGTGFSKSFTGFGRARHFPSLPREDSESPNSAPGGPFEDPSEPIYIDPSMFERSRSLRSIAVSPKRRTSVSS